jgi:hypothetical protein
MLFPNHTKTIPHNTCRKRTITGCQAASMPNSKSGWIARPAGRKKTTTKARMPVEKVVDYSFLDEVLKEKR